MTSRLLGAALAIGTAASVVGYDTAAFAIVRPVFHAAAFSNE